MNLYLVRGAPGAGKSTLAEKLSSRFIVAADHFFEDSGTYKYDASLIKDAHIYCQRKTLALLRNGHSVVVTNTFTKLWELAPYYDMKGEIPNLNIIEIVVWVNLTAKELAARCIHNVPAEKIQFMLDGFEHRKPVPPVTE